MSGRDPTGDAEASVRAAPAAESGEPAALDEVAIAGCIAVLEALHGVAPSDPRFVAVERAAAHLYKAAIASDVCLLEIYSQAPSAEEFRACRAKHSRRSATAAGPPTSSMSAPTARTNGSRSG